ncbi:T9SS type A sorting domain-containing protein [Flammeovirga yaeyamensis]|uniref:T9SS type A sorting domain-containing protein n=1 Tax=Flammeovirga yaeyamensis TaxID=367791 RepID=A0AAX1NBU1_9BACT|nr:T9SS type A sorting domain-containing protein [Flammeovirga yaeyamensis]MBB3699178.1 hypothetical protein [Flammeovirga yaeyamensis]NMF35558.1 T9SS type A sorting domain-containing protein [Flammeovirga yaeyamensis]QWG04416.1 T9SS type A sorting domain-containing protein [Flammeovirga yaeyamensis]
MRKQLLFLCSFILLNVFADSTFISKAYSETYYYKSPDQNINYKVTINGSDDWKAGPWYDSNHQLTSNYPKAGDNIEIGQNIDLTINVTDYADYTFFERFGSIKFDNHSTLVLNSSIESEFEFSDIYFSNGLLKLTGNAILSCNDIIFNSNIEQLLVDSKAELIASSVSVQNSGSLEFDVIIRGKAKIVKIDGQSQLTLNVTETGVLNLIDSFYTQNTPFLKICGVMLVRNFDGGVSPQINLCGDYEDGDCSTDNGNGGKLLIYDKIECSNVPVISHCGYITFYGDGTNCDKECGICDEDIDLPVKIIYFKGQTNPNGNLLIWETALEFNSSHFDIEASDDRKNWHVIGSEKASGNSDVNLKYQYLDKNVSGKFYRLAQYDFDGGVEYFGVVSFEDIGDKFAAKVYPTVTESKKKLKLEVRNVNPAHPIVGVLYNQNGVVINHDIVIEAPDVNTTSTYTTPDHLTSGVYILTISNGKNSETTKIVIP